MRRPDAQLREVDPMLRFSLSMVVVVLLSLAIPTAEYVPDEEVQGS